MQLPGTVQELADVMGRDVALFLVGQLPRCVAGQEGKRSSRVIMYVPTIRRLRVKHELVRILGWEKAKRLCHHFGGEILQPANCAEVYRKFRDESIVLLARRGMTPRELAEIMAVSVRHIRSLLSEIPQEVRGDAANDDAGSFQLAMTA